MISEDLEHLEELKEALESTLFDIESIINGCSNNQIKARAKSYWIAHIKQAISNDNDYLGTSMCTLQDTINEIREEGLEDDKE